MNSVVVGLMSLVVGASSPPVARASSEVPYRTEGNIALATGAGLGVVSLVAFTAGLGVERELRAEARSRVEADELMLQRSVAGFVAYPAAVLSAASIAAGVALLNLPAGTFGGAD